MKNLVGIERNEKYGLVVSSRVIANKLGKRHDNVVRDIEKLLNGKENLENSNLSFLKNDMIFENYYRVQNQKRKYKEYLLTKDGFTLYMFNIQGHNDFKIAYINEFNRMQEELKSTYQPKLIEPSKVKGSTKNLMYNNETVITLPMLSKLIKRDRMIVSSALKIRRVIAGNEIKAFKNENGILKGVSCVTIFNKKEVLEICEKLKVKDNERKVIDQYFTPDMDLIKESKYWDKMKKLQDVILKCNIEMEEIQNGYASLLEKIKNLKATMIGIGAMQNFLINKLEG